MKAEWSTLSKPEIVVQAGKDLFPVFTMPWFERDMGTTTSCSKYGYPNGYGIQRD
jgi:hypothetical protein